MPGQFIISLDFELLWGVRDHADRASYGANIMGAREAIPRILELFDAHGIAATWATVGFTMCGSRDELMESLPPRDLWPSYDVGRLSSYAYLDDVGRDERQDPYFLGHLWSSVSSRRHIRRSGHIHCRIATAWSQAKSSRNSRRTSRQRSLWPRGEKLI